MPQTKRTHGGTRRKKSRRFARQSETPRNDHTYHGRPRGQTRRRGVPAGTSIGIAAGFAA